MARRPGMLVKTESGKQGIVYKDELKKVTSGEKVQVHVIDADYKATGEKLLCDPKKLKPFGMVD
jgi:hypothetical protein